MKTYRAEIVIEFEIDEEQNDALETLTDGFAADLLPENSQVVCFRIVGDKVSQ